MRFRPVFLALALFVALTGAVYAQQAIQRATGLYVTFSSTNEAFDFEFQAAAVEICMHPGSNRVYSRFGTSMLTLEGSDSSVSEWATTSAIFQTGNSRLSSRAMVFTMTASEDSSVCRVYPFSTRGLVFQVDVASTASLDVNAFSFR